MIVEKDTWYINGYISSIVMIVLLLVAFLNIYHQEMVIAIMSFLIAVILMTGLTIVQPNEIIVVQFLGKYIGTVRTIGWIMTIPLTKKTKVSRKVQRIETKAMHITNKEKEFMELSAVVTYQIVDAAKATFAVESFNEYIQLEAYILINTNINDYIKQTDSIELIPLQENLKDVLQKNVQFTGVEIISVYALMLERNENKTT